MWPSTSWSAARSPPAPAPISAVRLWIRRTESRRPSRARNSVPACRSPEDAAVIKAAGRWFPLQVSRGGDERTVELASLRADRPIGPTALTSATDEPAHATKEEEAC